MTYFETIQLMMKNILASFSEVWHSVEQITIDGEKFPAAMKDDEFIDLSPTDQKETIYIRKAGDDAASGPLKISSCGKAYLMVTPVRIVFFRDHAEGHDKIIAELLQSVLMHHVKLTRVITNKFTLAKDESSGTYSFGPKTCYVAIDVAVTWELEPDTCDKDYCISVENPAKNCAVVI